MNALIIVWLFNCLLRTKSVREIETLLTFKWRIIFLWIDKIFIVIDFLIKSESVCSTLSFVRMNRTVLQFKPFVIEFCPILDLVSDRVVTYISIFLLHHMWRILLTSFHYKIFINIDSILLIINLYLKSSTDMNKYK